MVRFGSSTVFQMVRYMISESTAFDGTVAHTTVFHGKIAVSKWHGIW